MIDHDDVNTLIAEDRQYYQWERAQKNRILGMSSTERKQEEWRKLFPPLPDTDDTVY